MNGRISLCPPHSWSRNQTSWAHLCNLSWFYQLDKSSRVQILCLCYSPKISQMAREDRLRCNLLTRDHLNLFRLFSYKTPRKLKWKHTRRYRKLIGILMQKCKSSWKCTTGSIERHFWQVLLRLSRDLVASFLYCVSVTPLKTCKMQLLLSSMTWPTKASKEVVCRNLLTKGLFRMNKVTRDWSMKYNEL